MRWSDELNVLLNQCVFEAAYDFQAARILLLDRARQSRLLESNDGEDLSRDDCQVQWMLINPVEDESEGDEMEPTTMPLLGDDFHFYHPQEDEENPSEEPHEESPVASPSKIRPPSPVVSRPIARTVIDVPEGCPRLELTLSDPELEDLLSSLPSSASAHANELPQSKSEMQWVLSFLSDPQNAECYDIETKSLMQTADAYDDDAYQSFLEELERENLSTPRHADAKKSELSSDAKHVALGLALAEEDSSSDEDGDEDDLEWREARKQMKAQCAIHAT